jgi:hypothetical protein
VRDGILRHSSGAGEPLTLEGKIVRLVDRIAYINHDIDDALRAGVLQIEEVDTGAREQRGDGVSHADNGAQRGQGQKPVLGVDVRGVDGLADALQKVPLTVDDALRPAGAPGGKHDARGLVHT